MAAKQRQSRTAIVEAARDLFYHQGYDATSYADIAEQTGLGKGNIHYYFNAKEELLKAVAEHRVERIRGLLEEWSLDCGTPYDCLERFVAMFEQNADDLANYGCPMGTLNDELAKNHRELQGSTREMFDLFLRWLEARFRAIEPKAAARAHAEHLMIMAQGISVVAHSYGDPALARRQAESLREWLSAVCDKS